MVKVFQNIDLQGSQNWGTPAGTLGCAASIQIGSFYQAIMSEHFYSGHHTITQSCLS